MVVLKGSHMDGIPAVYLGRIVSKDHFRVFIYSPNGLKKVVNSWDEFESHMETGLWFATLEACFGDVEVPVIKRPRKEKS